LENKEFYIIKIFVAGGYSCEFEFKKVFHSFLKVNQEYARSELIDFAIDPDQATELLSGNFSDYYLLKRIRDKESESAIEYLFLQSGIDLDLEKILEYEEENEK